MAFCTYITRVLIHCSILTALLLCAENAFAEDIPYEIRAFGASHIAIILNYTSPTSLIVTPSSDGKTLRISGVGVIFSNKSSSKIPELISTINTLKRDNFTDLVVGLNSPAEFSSTPSTKSLQIFVSALRPDNQPKIKITKSQISSADNNIIINLPDLTAKTQLSRIFQSLAVVVDTFYISFIDSKGDYLGKDLADFPNEIDKGTKILVGNRGNINSNGF